MQFDAECIACLVRRQYELAERQPDRAAQTAFMRDVARTIADAPENVAAPWLVPGFARAAHRHFGITDAFDAIKRESNDRVLALLPRIREIVGNAGDPLAMAAALGKLADEPDTANKLGENARHIAGRLAIDRVAAKWAAYLTSVIR